MRDIKDEFCVYGDHMNTCHNCMWVYKWYMPPKVVYVSLPLDIGHAVESE